MPEVVVRLRIPLIPCNRCCYGGSVVEPRLENRGWRPGLIMSTEHREWLVKVFEAQENAPGPSNIPLPPGPLYVTCPECEGVGGTPMTPKELVPIFMPYGIELISVDGSPPV